MALLLILPTLAGAQCPAIETLGSVSKPAVVPELSGLAASIRHPGLLYGHNDSGDSARFYALNANGTSRATFNLLDVVAIDWEDIAVARIDGEDWIYIADGGNNNLERSELVIIRLLEPELPAFNQTVNLSQTEQFRIDFANRNEDVEGLAVEPVSGALILATRDRDDGGFTRVYRAIPRTDGGVARAALLRSLVDPPGGFRTKAIDWAPGRRFVLLQHSNNSGTTRVLDWRTPEGVSLGAVLADNPCITVIDNFAQAEGLAILLDGSAFIVGGEGNEDPLRRYRFLDPQAEGWAVY